MFGFIEIMLWEYYLNCSYNMYLKTLNELIVDVYKLYLITNILIDFRIVIVYTN